MSSKIQDSDTRMIEREQRRQRTASESPDYTSALPDLAASVATPSQEDLDKLRSDLATEGEARNRRIERFVKEGPLKPVPRAVVPVSENDL